MGRRRDLLQAPADLVKKTHADIAEDLAVGQSATHFLDSGFARTAAGLEPEGDV
jgi:hypothetical protein